MSNYDALVKDLESRLTAQCIRMGPEQVRERVRQVMLAVQRGLKLVEYRGDRDGSTEMWALCPFHDDKRVGSFSVNSDTGMFYCFVCGSQGSILRLARKVLPNKEYQDVAQYLTPDHLQLIRPATSTDDGMFPLPESLLAPFVELPSRLLLKGHPAALLQDLEIRYDHLQGRILFPVRNVEGQLVGIQTRAVDDGVKARWKWYRQEILDYLGPVFVEEHEMAEYKPPRSSAFYLEQYVLRDLIRDDRDLTFALAEGMGHVLRCIAAGFGTLGLFGTQLGAGQARRLMSILRKRKHRTKVILALDGDSAGCAAAVEIAVQFPPNVDVYIAQLPEGKDPEDLNVPHLRRVLSEALSLAEVMDTPMGELIQEAVQRKLRGMVGESEFMANRRARFAHKQVEGDESPREFSLNSTTNYDSVLADAAAAIQHCGRLVFSDPTDEPE